MFAKSTTCMNIYAPDAKTLRRKVSDAMAQICEGGGVVVDIKFDDRALQEDPHDFFALLIYEKGYPDKSYQEQSYQEKSYSAKVSPPHRHEGLQTEGVLPSP